MHTHATHDVATLKEISTIAAENNPNRVAFADAAGGRELTWSEYDERSRRAANALFEHLRQGDRVAFLCEASVDHVTLWNGALKAGAIVTNLHTKSSAEMMRYCIDEVRPAVLVLDEEYAAFFEERVADEIDTDLEAIVTTGEPQAEYEQSIATFLDGRDATEPDVRVEADDVAAILWTSGTTGRPKGWCHTNRGLLLKGMKELAPLRITRVVRMLMVFSPSFGAWYSSTVPAMLTNASTYFMRHWDPRACLELIDRASLTNATAVTTMWREVLRVDGIEEYDLDSLRTVGVTGEPVDEATLSAIREQICDYLINGYAATEVVATSIHDPEMRGQRRKSVGKPVAGTQVKVIEDGGGLDDELPPGETGEIVIKGEDCAVWAWGDTEKTESAFEDGWWFSGDLGYKDEDGYLFLEGRSDFMIKSKGVKVFPSPIEERLTEHPSVSEAAVVGVDDEEYGQMVTAIVARGDDGVTSEDLDEWCLESDEIARFERPREYYFVDGSLPRTASGKLDRMDAEAMIDDE
ncbi:class I adenylate-forming enzyme family protein [Halobellus clavatus]|jgi:acyl-coenzyme A synthetase/AMP-(fatty) acid ligase|uniref:Acyl-CoA synthetase (AMP-forming)/AMP-acid ligase II n=1 Tax=Halobellus clavatus TaxID=660517 RepID=A0A1H3DC39_9EURY|nr:class I adenylate-forming enzyme family protein [Halobellus clavatus]SDX63961.1 Acyl-CoA synthetase (AMP-forming)/AMP-acid ligase II [Halobellus clavatus]